MKKDIGKSEKNDFKLLKSDRVSMWWRGQLLQGSMNYERMQSMGWCFGIIPCLRRLYTEKEDRADALKRHLEFFNTQPYLQAPIVGVTATLEEKKAAGFDVEDTAIQGVKIGMMGPMAGFGDPIFWGTLRPVLGAFAAGLALSGSVLGPIIFFIVWNVIRMGFRWYCQEFGYRQGENITEDLTGGLMQKITVGAGILGMFIMGVLVPRWTTMRFPTVLSTVKINDPKALVDFQPLVDAANSNALDIDSVRKVVNQINDGLAVNEERVTTLQSTLDSLIPGLVPLLLTFFCIWLLRKGINPIYIIFGLFVVGILGFWAGIFG